MQPQRFAYYSNCDRDLLSQSIDALRPRLDSTCSRANGLRAVAASAIIRAVWALDPFRQDSQDAENRESLSLAK